MPAAGAAPPTGTWRDYAGRDAGPEGYVFGDLMRHLWHLITGSTRQREREAVIDEDDHAILDLKAQRDQLVGHRRRVEKLLARDEEAARALVKQGAKDRAMLALRKKKQHQQLVADCEVHIAKVDELITNIELTKLQKETVDALTAGVATIKKIQREIGGVDQVERLMDEHADAVAVQQEINDALAGAGVAADDTEALAEFESLQAAHAAAVLANNGAAIAAAAPAAPALVPVEAAPVAPAAAVAALVAG